MGFKPIYYITLCCPTVERSMDMARQYIEREATGLQIDMPSKEPVYETDFVKAMMADALCKNDGYDVYMQAFYDLKAQFPHVEVHLVVYPDVVESIGRQAFVDFYQQAGLASVMVAGGDAGTTQYLRQQGVVVIGRIDRMLDDAQLAQLSRGNENQIYNFNYGRHQEVQPHGLDTFADKIRYIRQTGVKLQIYAVEGIADKTMMNEVKAAGVDGALVGNVLMQLWDKPDALWELFEEFQSTAE